MSHHAQVLALLSTMAPDKPCSLQSRAWQVRACRSLEHEQGDAPQLALGEGVKLVEEGGDEGRVCTPASLSAPTDYME